MLNIVYILCRLSLVIAGGDILRVKSHKYPDIYLSERHYTYDVSVVKVWIQTKMGLRDLNGFEYSYSNPSCKCLATRLTFLENNISVKPHIKLNIKIIRFR